MRKILLTLLLVPVALSAQPRAKNVILFLADAGGLSTIAAASLHAYGEPRRLYVQRMPHIGLSDTTTASQIVSDSAAGMTAIVTGEKTHNGVISQSATAVRKKSETRCCSSPPITPSICGCAAARSARPGWMDWRRRKPRPQRDQSEPRRSEWATVTPARKSWRRHRGPAPSAFVASWRIRTSSA
jgi:hypothetical protein